ncbi:hypothetical protein KI999_17615 [Escherichia marmotae]|uniref:hypothetical protein n=1 Tax=Escherichia marmotae TaxID=1499973 RepID=UPI0019C3FB6C|nr:hypothetical protein [Escherichia marmotae]HAM4877517.1 hypothetical protein [Escherichia coli]MDQ9243128.1 hypothetical protein [Escherichia marmotae]MDQ9253230.1 hypothetical protein [Escherichia marmotae]MDQ9267635.1 hypothetical protein [Escherichia marmotae]MDQ9272471.1 hypothetical protein [Escherichia marmotae]
MRSPVYCYTVEQKQEETLTRIAVAATSMLEQPVRKSEVLRAAIDTVIHATPDIHEKFMEHLTKRVKRRNKSGRRTRKTTS